ncbi:unnamed protein product [Durusdinium trenchii]|uniref:RanBP2-type domain-containing protein n=1 Tax=Durusdinium trenchii TaxID=1381693 RepID=A0ABP0SBI2_9DINO
MSRLRRRILRLAFSAVAYGWWFSRITFPCFAFGPQAPKVPQAPEASDTVGRCLLGKEAWQFSRWRAETDDIRGGTSTASFKGLTDSSGFAEFAGLLSEVDQAFAGVSLQASFLPSLSELKGLVLDIHHGDGEEYAIALRMLGAPAGVEHVYRFQARPGSRVEMYFRDFQPTLREEVKDMKQPLSLERVQSIAFQTRSSFHQQGDFSLVISKLEGIPGKELPPAPAPARKTKWTCSACGTMNFDTSKYCTRCGESRNAEADRAARAKAEEERKQKVKWECRECGAKNFPSMEECFKCGAPRSRFRLHYSALSHSVQIRLSVRPQCGRVFRAVVQALFSNGCGEFKRTLAHLGASTLVQPTACHAAYAERTADELRKLFAHGARAGRASHVQSNSGAGAAKLMLAANTTAGHSEGEVTGTSPDAELSVGRSLSPHCFVQQKFGLSRDGRYLSLMFSPWLTRATPRTSKRAENCRRAEHGAFVVQLKRCVRHSS